ncbi:MAG: hypothetical protein GXW88_12240 [Pseudomonas lundensis]|uniref:hypothetical protein n=1 Tax=Pseudomonas lundensis TaxID=86185 RepID=UPI000641F6C7|nr:hypothetical protein [Pseudomonas lundensis]NLU01378.1 hypothetical protein [Pseudomonas lundensis]NNA05898.1 hypothetical protein [Pseudomonas lundensis]NNA29344.1 hypothetical protein [Pseudomonas lundensis]NNA38524.1 hypothetical protein [Pseudomonas lundensis]OZY50635.1 hypothetical protein CJF34_11435 [Pseudomonas lundensis]
MPVKHDLALDLGITQQELNKLSAEDPHLAALIHKYIEADQHVVEAEKNEAIGTSDDTLILLKDKRLKVKDKIVIELKRLGTAQHAQ